MLYTTTSIARFTLIEGWRSHLFAIAIGLLAAVALAAEFSAGLAITDTQSYRTGVYAALSRLALVLVVILFVATSVVRELQDRLLDLTLSRPVSRASWYLGRLLGFCALATVLALLAAAPLAVTASPYQALVWGVSLAAELCLISVACLTCVVTLRQVTLAVTATAAFYILARSIDAVVLMSRGPAVDPTAWSSQLIATGVEMIALVVPALERFTRAAWLGADAVPAELAPVLMQTVIYACLLIAVGLFDVYRLNE
jgi:ABC-type Na+ efflux pump permease subunit